MKRLNILKRMIGLAVLIGSISTVAFSQEEAVLPVRVGLTYGVSPVTRAVLEADGGFEIAVDGYDENAKIDVSSLVFEVHDGMLNVCTLFDATVASVQSPEKIHIYALDGEETLSYGGKPYRGYFEISANADGTLSVINVLEVEDYLRGVLPSEVYASWHEEALKTAAVAARTYALRSMLSSTHTQSGFDLCATTHCQVYGGAAKENARTDAALVNTSGLVLKYNGSLATTPYHSSNGGYTESAAAVWGSRAADYPYLTSVFTPYEDYRNVPNGKWETVLARNELSTRIASAYAEKMTDGIADIAYERAENGYIERMTVTDGAGNTYTFKTSDGVRSFFGSSLVKSANFGIAYTYTPSNDVITPAVTVISADGIYEMTAADGYDYVTADGVETTYGFEEVVVLDGSGYGHGVGLSQFGARCMADEGFNYEEILQTYFPGTTLEPLFPTDNIANEESTDMSDEEEKAEVEDVNEINEINKLDEIDENDFENQLEDE